MNDAHGNEPVTRSEFTTLQKEVTDTFKLLRDEMRTHQSQMSAGIEKIGQEQKEQMERIYKSARPQVTLWIMLAAVALTIISLVGGLIGYGFQREQSHMGASIQSVAEQTRKDSERTAQWVDYYIKRDLDELKARQNEERRALAAKP